LAVELNIYYPVLLFQFEWLVVIKILKNKKSQNKSYNIFILLCWLDKLNQIMGITLTYFDFFTLDKEHIRITNLAKLNPRSFKKRSVLPSWFPLGPIHPSKMGYAEHWYTVLISTHHPSCIIFIYFLLNLCFFPECVLNVLHFVRCHTLIRTKLSHFKMMNNFCDFCNKSNWKGTEKKRKRDSEDQEAKRRRVDFTNLKLASTETMKEK